MNETATLSCYQVFRTGSGAGYNCVTDHARLSLKRIMDIGMVITSYASISIKEAYALVRTATT